MPGEDLVFDLFSYARRGPGRRDLLTPAEIEQISRTVCRTPEVMVKVLSRGAQTTGAVRKHLDYVGRKGNLELETDEGERLQGRDAGEELVEDWDLDLESDRRGVGLASTSQSSPRLVHKILFSMAAGTPPDKVLTAVQNFCREEFGLKHRYAMALHTDEPHPHVHVVIKAVSEQGERLNIRKETLRQWRAEFAEHLRALGVPANATQRHARGETKPRKADAIYRAALRGESTHMRERAQATARALAEGKLPVEHEKATMMRTRSQVRNAWLSAAEMLARQGRRDLAEEVRRFADRLPRVRTEHDWLADSLLRQVGERRGISPRTR